MLSLYLKNKTLNKIVEVYRPTTTLQSGTTTRNSCTFTSPRWVTIEKHMSLPSNYTWSSPGKCTRVVAVLIVLYLCVATNIVNAMVCATFLSLARGGHSNFQRPTLFRMFGIERRAPIGLSPPSRTASVLWMPKLLTRNTIYKRRESGDGYI